MGKVSYMGLADNVVETAKNNLFGMVVLILLDSWAGTGVLRAEVGDDLYTEMISKFEAEVYDGIGRMDQKALEDLIGLSGIIDDVKEKIRKVIEEEA